MKESLFSLFIRTVPKIWLSHLVGYLVHLNLPGALRSWSLRAFANKYNINMEEAEYPLEHYHSIGDLFTRKLKKGLRPVEGDLVHPADSEMTQGGGFIEDDKSSGGQLIQCKGKSYSVESLLGSREKAQKYHSGFYCTYYLCPTDYHRVHSPVTGVIRGAAHIPGSLWPVNSWSVNNIDNLFAVNERVVTYIETAKGTVALIMIGATNVGKITMSYDKTLVTNRVGQSKKMVSKKYEQGISMAAGEEAGIFHMGSSAVVLYPSSYGDVLNDKSLSFRGSVLMGQSLLLV